MSSSNPISAERYYRNKSLLRSPVAYEAFFGLHENPFSLTPDPRYLFRTRHAHETLRQLTRGILARKGLLLLSGEVGTGKTTLLNSALQVLRENPGAGDKTRTAVLVHPTLTREEFIEAILSDFQISCEATRKPRRLQILTEMLLQVRRNRGIAVLAIDEAQLLSADLLDEIRVLLEMRSGSEELLQVVLCGHPDIEEKLSRTGFSSLQPEASVRCVTAPLSLEDTGDYIAHRMRIAGAKNESIFTAESFLAAYHHSLGIPRVVNVLCGQALASAGAQGLPHVTSRMVDEAAEKMLFPDGKPRGPHTRAGNSGGGIAKGNTGRTGGTTRPPAPPSQPAATPQQGASKPRRETPALAPLARIARRPERSPFADRGRLQRKSATARPIRSTPSVTPAANPVARWLGNAELHAWNQRIETWWSANLDRGQYYSFALLNVGLTGAVLLLLAQGPISSVSWQHTVQSTVGFLGLLLLDVALGLAGYIFLRRRLTLAQAQAPARFFWAGYRRLSAILRSTSS